MTLFPVRKEIARGGISIIAGLALWQLLAQALLENELLIPPPSSVARTFWDLAVSGQLNKHFAATATEFLYGFSAACIVGVVLGYLMGMHRWFDEIIDPWMAALYSIPVIALVPMIIIWFGIGIFSKIVVVFKITLVAIILNTAAGNEIRSDCFRAQRHQQARRTQRQEVRLQRLRLGDP